VVPRAENAMEQAGFGKAVKAIVALYDQPDGTATSSVLYARKRRRRKKASDNLRFLEKAVRRVADAQQGFHQTYRDSHERSNAKRRDGWVADLPRNLERAGRKAQKLLTK
jgi:hypothetical protein